MIHQYISNGYHIVMDVNSGSVHVMDKTAYDSVPIVERLLRQGTEAREKIARTVAEELAVEMSEAEETVEEILYLKEQGQLFAEDIYENYIDTFKNRETVVKALCLHIAHDCNLACRYCFGRRGRIPRKARADESGSGQEGAGLSRGQFRQPGESGS